MNSSQDEQYVPPTSAEIAKTQDSPDALRLNLCQRRLYTKAKKWQNVRWFGMLGIGILAPLFAVLWPHLAVISSAVAGVWIFLGRTTLLRLQQRRIDEAAAVQEKFDFTVFGFGDGIERSRMPSLEEVARLVGPEERLCEAATAEELPGWYPIDLDQDGAVSIAICQRANASYVYSLMKTLGNIWIAVIVLWGIGLVTISMIAGLPITTFFLGVVFPVLPAFLDLYAYWRTIQQQARDRRDLVRTIESKLANDAAELDVQDLKVWQESLYELRRSSQQVPDRLYTWLRRSNESAMFAAAGQLSSRVRRNR